MPLASVFVVPVAPQMLLVNVALIRLQVPGFLLGPRKPAAKPGLLMLMLGAPQTVEASNWAAAGMGAAESSGPQSTAPLYTLNPVSGGAEPYPLSADALKVQVAGLATDPVNAAEYPLAVFVPAPVNEQVESSVTFALPGPPIRLTVTSNGLAAPAAALDGVVIDTEHAGTGAEMPVVVWEVASIE